MKITEVSSNKLNIQVEADLPYMGVLIAAGIFWAIIIQHAYANNKTWAQLIQSAWDTRGTISYESIVTLHAIFSIIITVRLFTTEYAHLCTFDRQSSQIKIEKYRFLSRPYQVIMALDLLQDIQVEITPGGKCKYYSVALIFNTPKQSKLVLPERTIDRETTLGRVDLIRKFLNMPSL